jgi:hypothetical protein
MRRAAFSSHTKTPSSQAQLHTHTHSQTPSSQALSHTHTHTQSHTDTLVTPDCRITSALVLEYVIFIAAGHAEHAISIPQNSAPPHHHRPPTLRRHKDEDHRIRHSAVGVLLLKTVEHIRARPSPPPSCVVSDPSPLSLSHLSANVSRKAVRQLGRQILNRQILMLLVQLDTHRLHVDLH